MLLLISYYYYCYKYHHYYYPFSIMVIKCIIIIIIIIVRIMPVQNVETKIQRIIFNLLSHCNKEKQVEQQFDIINLPASSDICSNAASLFGTNPIDFLSSHCYPSSQLHLRIRCSNWHYTNPGEPIIRIKSSSAFENCLPCPYEDQSDLIWISVSGLCLNNNKAVIDR